MFDVRYRKKSCVFKMELKTVFKTTLDDNAVILPREKERSDAARSNACTLKKYQAITVKKGFLINVLKLSTTKRYDVRCSVYVTSPCTNFEI